MSHWLRHPSLIDYPGHLAAVFFVSGCNFRCGYCHNAGLLGTARAGAPWDRLRQTCARLRRDWAGAAVITGGEPTLEPEGLLRLITLCREHGWRIKLDTNGSRPETLARVLPLLDYVALDVKCRPQDYPELMGWDRVADIERSIDLLRAAPCEYEFRTTVLENIHTEEHMRDLAGWLRGPGRWTLQPFIPREDLPDPRFRSRPRTRRETLERLRKLVADAVPGVEIRDG